MRKPGWMFSLGLVFAWTFPLSHTWLLRDSRVFETAWAPLHFAWLIVCGFLLVFSFVRGALENGIFGDKRSLVLFVAGLALSYALTGIGAYLFCPSGVSGVAFMTGWEIPFFVAEVLVLGFLLLAGGWRASEGTVVQGGNREMAGIDV